ncbi:hypothetical protein [Persephonella sp.]
MGILNSITGLIKTGVEIADDFITTEEEKFEQMLKKEQLKLEREKAYLQDLKSARQMQIEALKQDDTFSKRFVYYFAILWTIIGASYIIGITFFEIPDKNIRFADTTLGFILGTIISQIIAFFYGSSLGSKSKEEVLKKFSK